MKTTVRSSAGSTQKKVLAAPPQKKSPLLPGIMVAAGSTVTPKPRPKPTPA